MAAFGCGGRLMTMEQVSRRGEQGLPWSGLRKTCGIGRKSSQKSDPGTGRGTRRRPVAERVAEAIGGPVGRSPGGTVADAADGSAAGLLMRW
jgi:hypothetical protein